MDAKDKIIFVGGGLGNTLIATRLRALRPEIPFVILEASQRFGGEHTWSFHESDFDQTKNSWVTDLISHQWHDYMVFFPSYQRHIPLGYRSIRCGPSVPASYDFHHRILPILGPFTRFGQTVTQLGRDFAVTADGTRYEGSLVIDGRGPLPESSYGTPSFPTQGYQKFFGLVVTTERPHGITQPIVMDTRVSQKNGYHFIYTLPFTDRTLLIEDTYYNMSPVIDRDKMGADLLDYGQRYLGLQWSPAVLEYLKAQGINAPASAQRSVTEQTPTYRVEEPPVLESGVLPIPLSNHPMMPQEDFPLKSGLRAGLFHPTTSYSFGCGVAFAQFFALTWNPMQKDQSLRQILDYQKQHWARGGFFKRLNNMLFLAAKPEQRLRVFEHFYSKDLRLIKNFYRGHLRLGDQFSLLSGRPPVPLVAGIKSFLGPRSVATPLERDVHAL